VTATPHRLHNPGSLPPPVGYSHAVSAAKGRLVFLGGQVGATADGAVTGGTIAEQLDRAASNVVEALAAAGARPEHLVSLHVFVTDVEEYRSALPELGEVWRRRFGRHYPAVALFGVSALFDPAAKVELVGLAVVPA
jgi:enamine deaminase RidA (YjgF/YER057c/UK114 family)